MITAVPFSRSTKADKLWLRRARMQSQQNRREPASVGIDKRIHDRLPFDRRMTITAFHSDGPPSFWGRTGYLSQGGIGATIVDDLDVNDVVSIQIHRHIGQEL